MEIYRTAPQRGWTSIPNAAIEQRDLSWKARGILAWLLSRPPGWKTDSTRLANESSDGRDAARTGLNELERAGYLTREKFRDSTGRWATRWGLHDEPVPESERTWEPMKKRVREPKSAAAQAGNPHRDGFPGAGEPTRSTRAGSPGAISKTENKTETKKNYAATPAAPSPGARATESMALALDGLEALEADVLDGEIVEDETPKPVTAQTILKGWIDWRGSAPNSRVLGQVAKAVKALLEEGIAPRDIEGGLVEMTNRSLNPATLASCVDNVVTSRTARQRAHLDSGVRSGGRPTPMQRTADILELGRQLQAEQDAMRAQQRAGA